jgi:hypothetical protein
VTERADCWPFDIEERISMRDAAAVTPIAYPVTGGRGYVELIAVRGECVLAVDALHHPFELDAEDIRSLTPPSREIVHRFIEAYARSSMVAPCLTKAAT